MEELDNNLINKGQSNNTSSHTGENKNVADDLKLICAIAETVLAIPILGGLIVLTTLWVALFVMIILHVVTLVYINKSGVEGYKLGNIIGIIGNILGFIPVVGMAFHMITAVILWIEYSKKQK